MEPDFQLDFLSTIIILRDYDGKIIKTSKELANNFFQMHLLEKDIYLDSNNTYWKKSTKLIVCNHQEYYQEEYTDVTKFFLENEKLLDNLKKDPLTKIANLNAVQEKINSIMMSNRSCIIAMCDVNDFKTINDTYGHAMGDKALIELSKLFESSIRENYDMVARIGGDEFLFIIMSQDITSIMEKLLLLETNVQELGKSLGMPLSVSIGVSYFRNGNDWNQKQCEADEALYHIKNNVDNKVAVAYFDNEKGDFRIYPNNQKLYFKQ